MEQLPTPADRHFVVAIAPNGARRTKADHPALPIGAEELGRAAAAAVDAGAAMIHLHVRDGSGGHALDAELYLAATSSIRHAVGDGIVVQITTESVGRYQPPAQMKVVRDVRPEAVSLALRELCPDAASEPDFAEFLAFLRRERIAPQFILYDADDVARFGRLMDGGTVPHRDPWVLYVLGRYTGGRGTKPADLLPFLQAAGTRFPGFMVCAFGREEAACGAAAALLGGGVRVGMENNLLLPNGAMAPDNAALIDAVVKPLRDLGLAPTGADALRARLLADIE